MKIIETKNLNGDKEYTVVLSSKDYATCIFNDYEKNLIDECSKSKNISDKLLALQIIAMKIEQSKLLKP